MKTYHNKQKSELVQYQEWIKLARIIRVALIILTIGVLFIESGAFPGIEPDPVPFFTMTYVYIIMPIVVTVGIIIYAFLSTIARVIINKKMLSDQNNEKAVLLRQLTIQAVGVFIVLIFLAVIVFQCF